MKKFSEFKPIRRIYEQEITLQNKTEEETTDTTATPQSTPQPTQQADGQQIVVTANVQSAPQSAQPQTQEETQEEQKDNTVEPVKLFSKLFESREMAHVYHLSVKGEPGSHAAHLALGTYYEEVLDLIDELIETYQGQYQIVEGYETIDTSDISSKEKVAYFEQLATFIKEARKCILVEDTHLHNIIDEIVGLIYKTLFKLKYNK